MNGRTALVGTRRRKEKVYNETQQSVSSSACFCVSWPANVFTAAGVTEIDYRVLLSPEPTTYILILLSESVLSWSEGINTSSRLVSPLPSW